MTESVSIPLSKKEGQRGFSPLIKEESVGFQSLPAACLPSGRELALKKKAKQALQIQIKE
jgi:hypothetical protein